jgi:hypothetical protein
MGKWDKVEEIADAITFVVEFVIFTLFIYEEGMQIILRGLLDSIASGNSANVSHHCHVNFDYIFNFFVGFFNGYGLLAVYGCNAYSTYLFACMFTREWAELYLGGGRMNYEFYKTGMF